MGRVGSALLWLATVAPSAAPPASSGPDYVTERVEDALGARLDELLGRYESYGFSGSVLVAKDGRIVLLKGYGLADRTRRIRNTPATLFEIGSLTKTFTAAAILALEAEGKLRTEDTLDKYLGPFPSPKAAATLHHLATHTAGLTVEGAAIDSADRESFIRSMKETAAESPPGERYRYTNAGFSLLAAVVEKVSGRSYEDYVRERLWKRADMAGAGFRGEYTDDDRRLAHGYIGSPAGAEEGPIPSYPWGTRGAGGIVATVGHLYQWHLALQTNAVLPEEARRKMFHPWPNEGYGWHLEKSPRGTPVIQKGGGMPNFAAHLISRPAEGLVVVWTCNDLRQRWRQTLNAALVGAALGSEHLMPPPVVTVDVETLRRHLGRYASAEGGELELRMGEGVLYAVSRSLPIPAELPFSPNGPGAFTAVDTVGVKLIGLKFEAPSAGRRGFDLVLSLPDRRVLRLARTD